MLPHKIVKISYNEQFVRVPCPVIPSNVKQWTTTERLKADKAEVVLTVNDLENEVCVSLIIGVTFILMFFQRL